MSDGRFNHDQVSDLKHICLYPFIYIQIKIWLCHYLVLKHENRAIRESNFCAERTFLTPFIYTSHLISIKVLFSIQHSVKHPVFYPNIMTIPKEQE